MGTLCRTNSKGLRGERVRLHLALWREQELLEVIKTKQDPRTWEVAEALMWKLSRLSSGVCQG
jgi:hypothetical protein